MSTTRESLDNLIRAMHNAVLEAQKLTDEQHIRLLNRYFDGDVSTDHLSTPKMLTIEVPEQLPDGTWSTRSVLIPKLALVPPSAMKLDTVSLKFKVGLESFEGDPEEYAGFNATGDQPVRHSGPLMVDLQDIRGGAPVADVEITFVGTEVPEAYQRLVAQLTVGTGH